MAGLNSVLGRAPAQGRAVPASSGPTAVTAGELYAAATTGANRITDASVKAQGGNAALAAGFIAFAAVGALVAMRFIFRGAIS